ncbi:MAG: hypothetical protein Q9M28_09515 [Mariprofundaceae bacterium]|nr:hypothetical protein [Mariprofundaceae bacterium]
MNVQMLFRSIVVALLVMAGFLVVQSNEQAREAEVKLDEWDQKYQTLFLQMQGLNASLQGLSTQLTESTTAIGKVKKEARKSRKIEEEMQKQLNLLLEDSGLIDLPEESSDTEAAKKKLNKATSDKKKEPLLDKSRYNQVFDQRMIPQERMRLAYTPERERPGFAEKSLAREKSKKEKKKKDPYNASYKKLLEALAKLNRGAYLLAENKPEQASQILKSARDDMWSAGKSLPEDKNRDRVYQLMDPMAELIIKVKKEKKADIEPIHAEVKSILLASVRKKKEVDRKRDGGREKPLEEKRSLAKVQLSWALAKVEEAERLMYQGDFEAANKHFLSAKSDIWRSSEGLSEIKSDLHGLMHPMQELSKELTEHKKTAKLMDVSDTLFALLQYIGESPVRQDHELNDLRLAFVDEEGGEGGLPRNEAHSLLMKALNDVDNADKKSSQGEYLASVELLKASKGKIWKASDMLEEDQPKLKRLMGPIDNRIRSYESGRPRSLKRVRTVLQDVIKRMGGQ